ncbi:MAG: DUF6226 family protein [Mycobacteriales bacterium]
MPSWPSPHPGMSSPREEEYSRVTEPERFRIVHARARVWADRLGDVRRGLRGSPLAELSLLTESQAGRAGWGLRRCRR